MLVVMLHLDQKEQGIYAFRVTLEGSMSESEKAVVGQTSEPTLFCVFCSSCFMYPQPMSFWSFYNLFHVSRAITSALQLTYLS